MDMTDAELKMVAEHLGHNVNIHMDIYRQQTTMIERTKVARILVAVENGCIGAFQGRKFESIDINGKNVLMRHFQILWTKTEFVLP